MVCASYLTLTAPREVRHPIFLGRKQRGPVTGPTGCLDLTVTQGVMGVTGATVLRAVPATLCFTGSGALILEP